MTEENPTRAFKGIWISAPIWLSKELTMLEKCLCAEIDSLSNPDCTASNNYLASILGSTPGSVAVLLTRLREKGLLLENESGGDGGKFRVLRLAPNFLTLLRQGLTSVKGEGLTSVKPPALTPVKGNGAAHIEERIAGRTGAQVRGGKRSKSADILTAEMIADFVLPPSIDTPEVKAALERWRAHRSGMRHPITRNAFFNGLVKDCMEWGADRIIAAVEHSIRKDYRGLFEPATVNGNGKGRTGGRPTAAERVERDRRGTYALDRDKFAQMNDAGVARDLAEAEAEMQRDRDARKGEYEE